VVVLRRIDEPAATDGAGGVDYVDQNARTQTEQRGPSADLRPNTSTHQRFSPASVLRMQWQPNVHQRSPFGRATQVVAAAALPVSHYRATSIPVSCGGVKTHVFMDVSFRSIAFCAR
jgi:hypothetical protein